MTMSLQLSLVVTNSTGIAKKGRLITVLGWEAAREDGTVGLLVGVDHLVLELGIVHKGQQGVNMSNPPTSIASNKTVANSVHILNLVPEKAQLLLVYPTYVGAEVNRGLVYSCSCH